MISIVVVFEVRTGYDGRFLERALHQAAETLRREPGCRQFDVCVDPADSHRVLLYEIYTSESAFDEHLRTPHFGAFDADTREWVREKIVERWRRVDGVD